MFLAMTLNLFLFYLLSSIGIPARNLRYAHVRIDHKRYLLRLPHIVDEDATLCTVYVLTGLQLNIILKILTFLK